MLAKPEKYISPLPPKGILLGQTSGDPRVLNRLLDRLRGYVTRQLLN